MDHVHSWAEIGDWYRGLALQRAEPTAAIKAKADELTRDAKSPEEQVRALYGYVAMQMRYVGISLGVGRYQPHAASEVLSNQYGDCKDKDTLLESLLKAKGFTTAPALIGAGIVAVPEVPTPAVFNHVITTVQMPGESGSIWLDSTAEVAPYRVLMPVLRDVNALVVPASVPASLVKTPADPPFPYRELYEATATLDSKGLLKAHIHQSIRSDNEVAYRIMMRQVSPSQWDQAMQYVAGAMGFSGKVSDTDLRQTDSSGPVQLSWNYTREDFADWKNGRILPLLPTLEVAAVDKDKAPEHDIDLGAPRTLEAHTVITLPEGYRVDLPDAVHARRPYTTFDKTYHFSDGKLTIDRVVVVRQQKLAKSEWKDYLALAKEADWDEDLYISLIAPSATSKSKSKDIVAAPAPDPSASVGDLLDQANTAFMHKDWDTVKSSVAAAKAKSPDTRRVHMWQAIVDAHDSSYDDAISEYQKELKLYPDSGTYPILHLASLLIYRNRAQDAVAMLKSYESRDDLALTGELLTAQQRAKDDNGALATMRSYLDRHPDNMNFRSAEASLLQKMNRREEAIASAKQVLEKSDDPNLLNNSAYLLVEYNTDLPYAEEKSRASIEKFATLTGAISIDEANSHSFNLSAQMVAAWDTLGDILLTEGKASEAIPYLRAAWLNSPDVVKGDHLAAALEAANRKSEAMWIDGLARKVDHPDKDSKEWKSIMDRDKRLKDAGTRTISGADYPESLQEMRTHKLKRTGTAEGGATVRVLIGGSGIMAVSVISGNADLKQVANQAVSMALPGTVPAGSKARVLHDAVLYCGKSSATCDFVFMPGSGIAREELTE